MLKLKVSGIHCGGCAASISQAVRDQIPGATVKVDIPTGLVEIDAPADDREKAAAIIQAAGFTVTGEAA